MKTKIRQWKKETSCYGLDIWTMKIGPIDAQITLDHEGKYDTSANLGDSPCAFTSACRSNKRSVRGDPKTFAEAKIYAKICASELRAWIRRMAKKLEKKTPKSRWPGPSW